ncbi:DUF3054 domain-containing protein [Mycobacterium sp. IDR2000157661]|uniref:DUF3054 domain-containing protein n=1 Tax=Mycobacterium sp. IDR2000157661 TaxID=2867005 RepID=UPI001EEB0C43|nr:DUF3054 domain-containing protein [Mycobacterium sp. IDR2000157661]ULE34586.1 DUF3054 domain-containing protein [Mycobacterium sp. IDR2000157661]
MTANSRPVAAALVTDLVCVVVFCTVGRRSHAEGLSPAGIAETAWPFLAGTLAGWLASTGWRRPYSLFPTGVVVWLATVVVGMVLRKLTSAGTAPSFIVVASISTAVLLLGWRGAVRVMTRG